MNKKIEQFFPVIAVVIIFLLLFRWYSMRTAGVTDKIDFNDTVQVEQLSQEESKKLTQGAEDVKSVTLKTESSDDSGTDDTNSGVIRYQIEGDKLLFSVTADLPAPGEGGYQVWMQQTTEGAQSTQKKVFVLAKGKGGYTASASVQAKSIPFEVLVTLEKNLQDETMEKVLLRGEVKQ